MRRSRSEHLGEDLWNAALQERIDAWRKAGKSISYEDQCASLTQIRGELPDDWAIMNCSSQKITLRRLNKAFQSFFRRVARHRASRATSRPGACQGSATRDMAMAGVSRQP